MMNIVAQQEGRGSVVNTLLEVAGASALIITIGSLGARQ